MRGKRFSWLPVILISLIAQFIVQQLLLFIANNVDHSTSTALIIQIIFVIVAIVGGIVAMHFSIRHSLHIGGICAALFVVLSQLYIGNSTISGSGLLILLIAYALGYLGSMLYANKLHTRFR
ncbi:hypothetical protein [Paenisporosarcina sp. TG20]|uniref:hypothetical protein n=1 Tax=Paenisporosarcina sp. TG20 TaxID=1211706 RepID=UPI00031E422C|nr:hypothetical protein [Paenisporosarcina sp. TG20]